MWRLIKFLTKFSKYISATNILETISCYLPKNILYKFNYRLLPDSDVVVGEKGKG